MDKKLKRITLIMILLFLLITPVYCYVNLKKYSIWYAQHMSHIPETDPVIWMVAENVQFINHPSNKENEEFKYDYDGHDSIHVINYDEGHNVIKTRIIAGGSRVWIYECIGESERDYLYNSKGTLYWNNKVKRDVTNKERNDGHDLAYSIIQPFIDEQYIPSVNLQWLFNLMYYDQFN